MSEHTIHNTLNLYLRLQKNAPGGNEVFVLTLQQADQCEQFDVPLIYDVPYDDAHANCIHFIINNGRPQPRNIFYSKYIVYATWTGIYIPNYRSCSPEDIISDFYKRQPDFEIRSPGFSDVNQCKQWWKNHHTRTNATSTKNTTKNKPRKTYFVLAVPIRQKIEI